jgi:hypothetical protein
MEEQDLRRVMAHDDVDDVLSGNMGNSTGQKRKRPTSPQPPPREKRKTSRKKKRRVVEEDADDMFAGGIPDQEFMSSLHDGAEPKPTDPIPRRKKIQKIEAWFATFPNKLEKIRENVDLESMSEVQLDTLLLEIKQVVGAGGGGAIGEMLPVAGLTLYEGAMVALGINVQGITALAYEPNFSQACKEVMLEFTDMTYIPPHWRALLMLGNTTYHLHEKNSSNKGQPQTAKTQGGSDEADMMREAGKNYQSAKNSEN